MDNSNRNDSNNHSNNHNNNHNDDNSNDDDNNNNSNGNGNGNNGGNNNSNTNSSLCLCFPCIISYLEGYIYPTKENQHYPILQRKGFTQQQQRQIAEEWYWIAFERETAVNDYMRGYATFRDGCWWRRPPVPRTSHCNSSTFPSSSSSSPSSSPSPSSPSVSGSDGT